MLYNITDDKCYKTKHNMTQYNITHDTWYIP